MKIEVSFKYLIVFFVFFSFIEGREIFFRFFCDGEFISYWKLFIGESEFRGDIG